MTKSCWSQDENEIFTGKSEQGEMVSFTSVFHPWYLSFKSDQVDIVRFCCRCPCILRLGQNSEIVLLIF